MADKYASMYSTADGPRLATGPSTLRSEAWGASVSGFKNSAPRTYGVSTHKRSMSNPRYSASAARNFVDEDRISLLERKIERARKENAMMKALYESDKILALANYGQRAGELNNRVASTYFKPLYLQQQHVRSESVKFNNQRVENSMSHSKLMNEKSKSRNQSNGMQGENMFMPTQAYNTHKHSLKPASFVEAINDNILDTSAKSRSMNASKTRGKSTKSNKSDISIKKTNKSALSKKGDKSTMSKKQDKSTISKKSKISKPNKSTISKKSKLTKPEKSVLTKKSGKSQKSTKSKALKSLSGKPVSLKPIVLKSKSGMTSKLPSAVASAMNNKKAAVLSALGSGLGLPSFLTKKSKH